MRGDKGTLETTFEGEITIHMTAEEGLTLLQLVDVLPWDSVDPDKPEGSPPFANGPRGELLEQVYDAIDNALEAGGVDTNDAADWTLTTKIRDSIKVRLT